MMNDKQIAELLRQARTVAVVGLSSNRMRASFGVSRFLQRQGYRIIPVNPNETEILGEKAYGRLVDVPDKVDIANIFRRSDKVPEAVDDALQKGARCIWMQEGVINHAAAQKAESAGIPVVMNRCILKELARLLG